MAATLNFSNVFLGGKDRALGELRADGAGLKWRSVTSGKVVQVAPADMRGLSWAKVRGGHQLRVHLKGGNSLKFEGLKQADHEGLAQLSEATFGHELRAHAISAKGLSWGAATVDGATIRFEVDSAEAFEIPLSEVQQATMQGKAEVSLEMHLADTLAPEDEMLTEIRFTIPTRGEGGADGGGAGLDEEDEDGALGLRTAEDFLNKIISKADLAIDQEAIVSLNDVPLAVPRGRYEIEFYSGFLKLHGKSYAFKVMYSSVVGIYSLPKPDQYHVNVAVHLEPPIRQGATFYQFLLLQFPAEETLDLSLNLTKAQLADKFGGRLPPSLAGPSHEVVAKLVAGLTDRPLHRPAGTFKSAANAAAIRCAIKADEGFLFFFDRAFLFVNKPVCLLPYEQVSSVEFRRVEKEAAGSAASRSFDMVVTKRSGEAVQFANIRRNEYQPLFRFLVEKKLKIKNIAASAGGLDDEFEEEEEEDAEGEVDLRKAKRAREAAKRKEQAEDEDDEDEDDDDDESDEDFKAGDESEVDEEYEEEEIAGDDEKAPKLAGSTAKKGKRDEASESESESAEASGEDGGDERKPPKAKPKAAASPGDKAKRAKKAKKDPNAPKRPLSAYMLFSQDARAALKAEQPGLSIGEMGKQLGTKWKELGAEEKAVYEGRYQEAKAAYAQAAKAYKKRLAEEGGGGPFTQHKDEEESEDDDEEGDAEPAVVDDDEDE